MGSVLVPYCFCKKMITHLIASNENILFSYKTRVHKSEIGFLGVKLSCQEAFSGTPGKQPLCFFHFQGPPVFRDHWLLLPSSNEQSIFIDFPRCYSHVLQFIRVFWIILVLPRVLPCAKPIESSEKSCSCLGSRIVGVFGVGSAFVSQETVAGRHWLDWSFCVPQRSMGKKNRTLENKALELDFLWSPFPITLSPSC